jgi:hypothetical protein
MAFLQFVLLPTERRRLLDCFAKQNVYNPLKTYLIKTTAELVTKKLSFEQ